MNKKIASKPLNRKNSKRKPKPEQEAANQGERLQKVLARAGYGSRRKLETMITEGRVKLNGKVAELGARYVPGDLVKLNGKLIPKQRLYQKQTRVIMYHKPVGEVTTKNDPEGRPTVFDNLPKLQGSRWVAIGRLDIATSGLLLFTNNGELANKLMHPSFRVKREYAVRVLGKVTSDSINKLQTGVQLDDGNAKFDSLVDAGGDGANHWYHVTLCEGRNREVRRMWEAVGHVVSRLARIRYADIALDRAVRAGKCRELNEQEIQSLIHSGKK